MIHPRTVAQSDHSVHSRFVYSMVHLQPLRKQPRPAKLQIRSRRTGDKFIGSCASRSKSCWISGTYQETTAFVVKRMTLGQSHRHQQHCVGTYQTKSYLTLSTAGAACLLPQLCAKFRLELMPPLFTLSF